MTKEYCGAVTLIARIDFDLEAKSLEEAKQKIMDIDYLSISFDDENGKERKDINIQGVEWHLVENSNRGNVQEYGLEDLSIDEI